MLGGNVINSEGERQVRMTAEPRTGLTWEQLEEKGLIERYGDEWFLTPKLEQTIRDGESWQDYYKGEYSVIRKDKLAILNQNTATLRTIQGRKKQKEQPTYCHKCGTKLRTMLCDSELTYCPECDLPHEY